MTGLDRRELLCGLAFAVLAAASRPARAAGSSGGSQLPLAPAGRVPAPIGVLTQLPGPGNQIALTVDDGASVEVVGAFAQFCRDSGTRLTFFANGINPSWTVNAPALRPLVDSGQVQIGNHTWSHPHLGRLSPAVVNDQILRNANFLAGTYGTNGAPYFRPPYGEHNLTIDRIAADLGYTTITMWSGTIGDSRPISEGGMLAAAAQSFLPQRIVLTHANLPTVTHCYAQLVDLIHSRNLTTVTLDDVFG
ncbi:putative xylanase/chitin deacetylase [Mycolicibacterium chubuense NBB4]|uniref:Putative xylanase/chitin deacetylase n=1 Tax=Mycolicibacterium chubuense (strain NBB4) TaxID=710421 RepID=I4BCJ0_MYCCN|nr:polysaccharide deacetylase family protein [Mycolicibacterium chubuense]AFM14997.1 putative xylanase/chitin deacetylase [Mycolicibacterium chubuense NBB4]